ncbi:MAG: BCCT family transporter, partial [Bacteroidota bacterium]
MRQLRHGVFWPPFLLLILAVVASRLEPVGFLDTVKAANNWILDHFSWLFNVGTLLMVLVCVWLLFAPIGRRRIGGAQATPIFTRWQWFAIALCTTIATGILFWGTAEPLYHLGQQPGFFSGDSPEAKAQFALSTMFMHWSFTPYAIYAIPALMFALAYYNRQQPFSLGAALFPVLRQRAWLNNSVDAICLYALVAGMAASLGDGTLSLTGGLNYLWEIEKGPWLIGLVCGLVVVAFVLSALSGITKGIRILSDINIRVFVVLCLFVLLAGPTLEMFQLGLGALGEYVQTFFPRSLYGGWATEDPWPKSWTTFYWANWLAWAPITALFLGRIAVGYTIREFMLFNWVFPALFALVWMTVFSGSTLHLQLTGQADLSGLLQAEGPESVMYGLLAELPWTAVIVLGFLGTMFLSYVTAADSNTE